MPDYQLTEMSGSEPKVNLEIVSFGHFKAQFRVSSWSNGQQLSLEIFGGIRLQKLPHGNTDHSMISSFSSSLSPSVAFSSFSSLSSSLSLLTGIFSAESFGWSPFFMFLPFLADFFFLLFFFLCFFLRGSSPKQKFTWSQLGHPSFLRTEQSVTVHAELVKCFRK